MRGNDLIFKLDGVPLREGDTSYVVCEFMNAKLPQCCIEYGAMLKHTSRATCSEKIKSRKIKCKESELQMKQLTQSP